ncbi:hypothetical protein NEMBOFW57_010405 [Staphylotrichum longicolle]|uniref:DUF7605 domain-containing protein n=1 Tax=Staphylotrichum longicolle TaxID=669026 RepID=A0AAD4EN32_9PEZI|nr:hypothetical protein NEMBOFW57_010405 [Staphylotrichum longicolle]
MIDYQHPAWMKAADAEAKKWEEWRWNQYSAWCGNNGRHSTTKRTADWNAKIIWKMRAELDFQWDIVEEEIGTVFGELLATVRAHFNVLTAAISTTSVSSGLRARLLVGISAGVEGCEYAVTRTKEIFAQDVKPPPENAKIDRGLGKDKKKRQIHIVEARIRDEILFPSAAIALQQRLDALLDRQKTMLTAILAQVANGVEADLKCVLGSHMGVSQEDPGADRFQLQRLSERSKVLKARAEEVRRIAAA